MNVGIVTVAMQFLFWEYLSQIFGIVSLQCGSLSQSVSQQVLFRIPWLSTGAAMVSML
jgi:hypothetical protein